MTEEVPPKSLLSDKAIMKHIAAGSVVIQPFDMANLSTSSYDVTLGPYYFKEEDPEPGRGLLFVWIYSDEQLFTIRIPKSMSNAYGENQSLLNE